MRPSYRRYETARLAAVLGVALVLALPSSAHAQTPLTPDDALPHVFVRTRTAVDANAWRSLDGEPIRRRQLTQRLDVSWWSRTAPDVLGHTSFSTRFDANLASRPTPAWRREEQLEPTLHEARVELRLPAGLRLNVGRLLSSSPFEAGTLDGIRLTRRGRGLQLDLRAGRRPDASRQRLADWAWDPEAELAWVPASGVRWLEGTLGWSERWLAMQLHARAERAQRFSDDVRVGADLRIGASDSVHARAAAFHSPRRDALDRVDIVASAPFRAHRLRAGIRYERPRFPLHSSFVVYPLSERRDAWVAAALKVGGVTVAPEFFVRQRRAVAGEPDARTYAGTRVHVRASVTEALRADLDGEAGGDTDVWLMSARAGLTWQTAPRWTLGGSTRISAWRDPVDAVRRSAVGSATSATVRYQVADGLRIASTTVLRADDVIGTAVRWVGTADLRLPGARW